MTEALKISPQLIQNLLNIPIYLVGGAVRDTMLGKPVKDWDFTTPANPDEIEAAIAATGRKTYTIGKKFGTIGFKLEISPQEFEYVEITTFRKELYLEKNRKPQVDFVKNIQEDLSRRDFTINSMAMKPDLKLIDPFDGVVDLKNKIIRAVGNPKIRFKEDPLRMLRAIRFASSLDFIIEQKTWDKLCSAKWSLLDISKERWVLEMDKILSQKNPEKGLDLLMNSGLLGIIIPELSLQQSYDQNSTYHDFDLWTHTKNVLINVPHTELNLRWTALLHDIAKPFTRTENKQGYSNYLNHELLGAEMANKVCNYLKFSNERTAFIIENITNHLKTESPLKKHDDGGKKIKSISS
jgi:tRNA nucleotidyltransferase (CCA-adding enzyme)